MTTDTDIDQGRLRADLEALVALPSVAFPGFPTEPVRAAADLTEELLREAGLEDVVQIDVPGAAPAVFGQVAPPAGSDAPTVLLYAHYDVQPAGPEDAWTTPAFTATERDGRLYGRGTADDKCGIALHVAALRALGDLRAAGLGIKVLVEGEEETGEGTLSTLVAADPDRFRADAFVIADGSNVATGTPTLTTSLRGFAVVEVTVSTLRDFVHSGVAGGAAPDALVALSRIIATLHDEDGDVAVAGLDRLPWDGDALDEEQFRREAGVLDGVALVGSGPLAERLLTRPSVTAVGIDAPTVRGAGNALIPSARAKLSMRLAPTQDPRAAADALVAHVRAVAPWGVQLAFEISALAPGALLGGEGPVATAAAAALEAGYAAPVSRIGTGGAIPLCADLAAIYPDAEFVLWGAGDDRSRIHAADESVDLGDLGRAAAAELALLRSLGTAG
ncbi:M20/M25/M40 family metallo-hydrolase [Patulibacter brassicae]|jgi:acetylornithine deacetylase/succinyl-diaminopimelate desuccinylase-like protein|uniref:M20/M25/M40 family metallo-hydrolase n=1 Tax=Patulibacter brassicae TaxID=1705717 RepID=A0ABU4VJD2_9ACTN|nr:M20/M25/M40 family metallo-hydrolase [Patulibacter brassicae]MDX8151932.1 M20/M25/M40 family metallo-hydrolase [Patulibacter brassicae]